jgi:hypothetical protein
MLQAWMLCELFFFAVETHFSPSHENSSADHTSTRGATDNEEASHDSRAQEGSGRALRSGARGCLIQKSLFPFVPEFMFEEMRSAGVWQKGFN